MRKPRRRGQTSATARRPSPTLTKETVRTLTPDELPTAAGAIILPDDGGGGCPFPSTGSPTRTQRVN